MYMSTELSARIPVTEETREMVKAQKRGGQSYDALIRMMVEQYDPEASA